MKTEASIDPQAIAAFEPLEPRVLLSATEPTATLLASMWATLAPPVPLDAQPVKAGASPTEDGPCRTVLTYPAVDVPLAVPDPGTVTSALTVADSYLIGDLNVAVDVEHTWDADLDIHLVAPGGVRVALSTGNGGWGEGYAGTVFDDQAPASITDGDAPFAGSFRPEGQLAVLNGTDVQGTWQLEVADTWSGDAGVLRDWALIVSDTPQDHDDDYEDNDSKAIVDARPPGGPDSPNLGPVESVAVIEHLVLGTDGEDWWRFETVWPSDSGHLAGIVFSHAEGDLDLELLAADGTTVLDSSDSADDFERVSLAGLAPGTYYLRVFGYAGATNPDYALAIWPGSQDDPYEDNDSTDVVDARPAGAPDSPNLGPVSGALSIDGLILGTDWDDYYRFSTSAPGGAGDRLAIEFAHAGGDLDLKLLSESGGMIDYSNSSSDNEEISLAGLPAGTYYAYVYGYDGAQNDSYTLILQAPVEVGDDPYENNDSMAIVAARPPGGPGSPNLGPVPDVRAIDGLAMVADSEDWFRFEMPQPGRRGDYVRIRFAHAAGDLDLELRDEAGSVVAESFSVSDDERIRLAGVPAGVYYVRVHGWDGATNPAYSLRVQTHSPDHRLLSAPFATGAGYTLRYELLGEAHSGQRQLEMGPNALTVPYPNGGAEPFELIFDVTRVGSLADQSHYQYDLLGNVSRKTDALGQDILYGHDGLGRLTDVEGPGGELFVFAYDGNDNLQGMLDGQGITVYLYNELDRLELISLPDETSTVEYDHDLAGRVAAITYPDGTVVAYGYDEAGRLQSAACGGEVTRYAYYPVTGLLHAVTLPNGITGTYGYDPHGRLTSLEYRDDQGGLVVSFGYTLDGNGNRTSLAVRRAGSGAARVTEYRYDGLDRLVRVDRPDGTVIEYEYDEAGNRLSTTTDPDGDGPAESRVETFAYGQDNRLESVAGPEGTTDCFYDPRGNLVMVAAPDRTIRYEYDFRNLLVSADDGTDHVEYLYGGDGSRVARIANGVRTTYVNDPNRPHAQVLMELDEAGQTRALYTYGLGRISGLLAGQAEPVYYVSDALGSTTDLTDPDGAVVQSYSYDAFGAALPADPAGGTGSTTNTFGFTGEDADPITGLVYLRARYYDPATGRFLSKDPGGFADGPNMYGYVRANPVRATDPSGTNIFEDAFRSVDTWRGAESDRYRGIFGQTGPEYERLHGPIDMRHYTSAWNTASRLGGGLSGFAGSQLLGAGVELVQSWGADRGSAWNWQDVLSNFVGGLAGSLGVNLYSPVDRGGVLLDRAVEFVGDLGSITGATVDPVTGQVVLLGTAGDAGGPVPELRLDDFVTAVRAVFGTAGLEPPGVTIDPQSDDPAVPQEVRLFAGIEDTDLGYVVFEADRAMKCLAAREDNITGEPVGSSVAGYYSLLDRWFDRARAEFHSGSSAAESRFWFVPTEMKLVRTDDGQAFVFDRTAVTLMTEDMVAGNGATDPDAEAFADWFNANFTDIAAEAYPCPSRPGYEHPFRRLEQVARAVAFARFLYDSGIPIDFSWIERYDVPFVDTPETTPTVVNSRSETWQDPGYQYELTIAITGGATTAIPLSWLMDTGEVQALSDAALDDRPDELTQHWETQFDGDALDAVAVSLDRTHYDGLDSRADRDLSYQTAGEFPLELTRYYSSASLVPGSLGWGWEVLPYDVDFSRPALRFSEGFPYNTEFLTNGVRTVVGDEPNVIVLDVDNDQLLESLDVLNGLRMGELRVADRATGRTLAFESELRFHSEWLELDGRERYVIFVTGLRAEGVPTFTLSDTEQPDGSTFAQDPATRSYVLDRPDGSRLVFDGSGGLLEAADARQRAVSYGYTGGRVTSISDAAGQTIALDYDGQGRLRQAAGLGGEVVTYTYSDAGDLIEADRVRQGRHVVFAYAYSDDHQLVSVTLPDQVSEGTSDLDALGRVTDLTDPRGSTFHSDYSLALGQTTLTDTISGDELVRKTDSLGRLVEVTDPLGRTTRYTYMGSNRQPSRIELPDPDRPTVMVLYDDNGNVTLIDDPVRGDENGDGLDEHPLQFHYDPDTNNLDEFTDARGLTTRYAYNEFNQVTSMTRAVGTDAEATWTYEYHAGSGFLKAEVDPTGVRTEYVLYDARGNLLREVTALDTPAETVTVYGYDEFSRRRAVQQAGADVTYVYNGEDRVTSTTLEGPEPLTAASTYYEGTGWKRTDTDFNGHTTTYAYDSATGDLVGIDQEGAVTRFEYDRFGNVERIVDPAGNVTVFAYDALQRLTGVTSLGATPRVVAVEATGTEVVIGLSEPMNADAADVSVKGPDGIPVGGGIEFSADRTELTWRPGSGPLAPGGAHTITLRAGGADEFVSDGGVWLDGEFFGRLPSGDGAAGGHFVHTWTVDDHGDDAPHATALALPAGIDAELDSAGDADWFRFEAGAGSRLAFDVVLGTLSDSVLRLYGPDGRTLLEVNDDIDTRGGQYGSHLEWEVLQTGAYYLSVRGHQDQHAGSYRLNAAVLADDHGDTPDEATPVNVPSLTPGHLEVNSDTDWVSFQAVAGQTLRAAAILGTLADSVVTLYGPDQVTVLEENDDFGDGRALPLHWDVTEDGTYYVAVRSYDAASKGTYRLAVSADDHRDGSAGATALAAGSSAPGEIEIADDRDWFGFQADGGDYRVEATPAAGGLAPVVLTVYDGWEYQVDLDASEARSVVYLTASPGESFFIEVSGQEGGTGGYELAVTALTDDHGGDPGSATPMTVGEPMPGELENPADQDCFAFLAEGGRRYRIDVALGTLFDSELALLDADGQMLDFNDDHDGWASRIDWTAPADGIYYPRVASYGDNYAGAYTLTVEPLEQTPPVGALALPVADSFTNVDLGYVDVTWTDAGGSGLDLTKIDATDVRITGVATTGIEHLGGDTWRFFYDGPLPEGPVQVVLPANHVADNAGNWNRELTCTFVYDVTGPRASARIRPDGVVPAETTELTVDFAEPVPALTAEDVSLIDASLGPIQPDGVALAGDGTSATLTFHAALPARDAWDTYTLTIRDSVRDLAGNALDGDADGQPGGDFQDAFSVFFLGDANGDGVVNWLDIGPVATHYNQDGMTWPDGDFSGDGTVNFSDVGMLATNYGRRVPNGGPPRASLQIDEDRELPEGTAALTVSFSEPVAAVTPADVSLTEAIGGPMAPDDVSLAPDGLSATATFSAGLPAGSYTFVVLDTVRDLSGYALDGDGDGAAGRDYEIRFTVVPAGGGGSGREAPADLEALSGGLDVLAAAALDVVIPRLLG